MKFASLSLYLVFLHLTLSCSDEVRPVFCGHLDCPKYSVENKSGVYEERIYDSYNWASTFVQITGKQYRETEDKGFIKLFNYISGHNNKHEEIPIATPVLTKVYYDLNGQLFCPSNFTVSFFISFKYQTDPPVPTDNTIVINKCNTFSAFVISFGGYMKLAPQIRNNVKKLADALERDGLGKSFIKDYFYTAVYDNPYVVNNRHNEIWLIKK